MNNVTTQRRWGRHIFSVFLCLLVCGYYYFFFFNRTHVQLDMEVSQNTVFKLYWADDGQDFSEKKRTVVHVSVDKSHYEFFLTDLTNVKKLRIDPLQYEGEVLVKGLTLSQKGYKPITIDFEKLVPLQDIADYSFENNGLRIVSGGGDPNFLFLPEIEREKISWVGELAKLILVCIFLLTVVRICSPLRGNFAYIPAMLAIVFVLVVTMAAVSKRNAHPDEYVHLDATSYYQENWLPPEIEDKAIEHTYSVYGMSRLNNGEIYYLLAGKMSQFGKIFKIDELFSLRLFNVVLFAFIVLYTIYSVPARMVAVPFLLSPQVWYIFSYCGSDAFALFICFIAGCELIRTNSYLNRIIRNHHGRGLFFATLFLAVMLAMLFLLKKNYYPFIAFFYIFVLWQIFRADEREARKIFCKRLVVVTVMAIALTGLRIGADYYVNGSERQEKMLVMQEKMAHPWYKPSTELHEKHTSLYLKARGTTFKELLVKNKWLEKSFITGFGVYGYFTIAAPELYYDLVKWAAGALLFYIFLVLFMRGGLENITLAMIATGLSVALIGVSFYHSWTMDFQAQGRYLFPILPMLGIVLGKAREIFDSRLFILGVTQLYLLGLYSFIFIALLSIPRPA